jgi:uncharacterized repeat protein (TIGR01451 family)
MDLHGRPDRKVGVGATRRLGAQANKVVRHLLAMILVLATGLFARDARAQVQRSFLNLSFELPVLVEPVAGSGCNVQVTDAQVPGWTTNHPVAAGGGDCVSPLPANGPLIELWRNNYQGVPARTGSNFAELNAEANSRLSQNICLAQGEVVRWKLSHRGRSAGGRDVMSFNIDSNANRIMRGSTTNTGSGLVSFGQCGGGQIGSATCAAPTTTNTWADYSGNFTWNGTSALHSFGFEAISTANGSITIGNFLDEIQIFLAPHIELTSAGSSGRESAGNATLAKLVVSGLLESPLTINLQVNTGSSTATLGSDFSTPSGNADYSITIPAGNYDGTSASQFAIGLNLLNDAIIENNETVAVRVLPNPSVYTIAGTQSCGAVPINQIAHTIIDDDVDLRTSKRLDTSATPPGGSSSVQFTVTFDNNTARPTVGDTTAHDAVATLADALPAGFTAFAWTCSASGTPTPSCPAASGSGAINTTAFLPAGNNAAGGALTYVVTGTLAPTRCTATPNTSTIAPQMPISEGSSAQNVGSFNTPAPGGIANNTATASVDPVCADLSISKTNTPGQNGNVDQNNDTVTSGGPVNYSIVVNNAGPDAADNAIVNDTATSGLSCTTASCVVSSGLAVCPAIDAATLQSTGGVAIASFPANSSLTFTLGCTVP